MKKIIKKLVAFIGFGSLFMGGFFLILICSIVLIIAGSSNTGSGGGSSGAGLQALNPEVTAYLPVVQKYAQQYEIPEYTNLIMCIMQIESDGLGDDPMQASECEFNTKYLPREPGAITDKNYSVEVGVQYLADTLAKAKCANPQDIPGISLTAQSYNFGPGFITWANNRGGYTKENAVAFCEMMKAEMGWDTYGNPNYVDRLMLFYLKFLQEGEGEYFPDTGTTQFMWPLPDYDTEWITCWYGQNDHNGLDIAAPEGTPIVAAEAGIVEEAYFHESWGNNVYIKHNSQYGTRYAHMVRWAVSVGQEVKRGQVVGYVGDTGYSFGNHLHFEVYNDGTRIDPYPFIS